LCLKRCLTSECECNEQYYQCKNGGCIPYGKLCDCFVDCPDGSDEICPEEFCKKKRCPNILEDSCLPREKLCVYERDSDGNLLHCETGSHLQNCFEVSCPHMFQCIHKTGYCIPFSYLCDGVADCPDGRDEFNCSHTKSCPGLFRCSLNNECIHMSSVGDGVTDCRTSNDDE
ncbi:hypothetical protein CAPTEDRAFT_37594, partial [Capitella teleta]